MQARVIGGFCLLAFLLSIGRAEEQESKDDPDVDQVKETVSLRKSTDLEAPGDLKSEINLAVPQSNIQVSEGRSGDVPQNYARSLEDSQSQAFDSAGGAPAFPFNPFNEELGPYKPSETSFSQAEAQAIKSDSHGQGMNSYSNPASYPYNSGLPTQAQVENGFYQRDKYGQGLSPGQAPNQVENELYQPGYHGLPNVSPYNQGSNFPPGQDDSESNQPIFDPNFMLLKPVQSVLDSPSILHTQDNSVSYQPVHKLDSKYSAYEQFLVPYKGPNSAQTQSYSEEYLPVPIIEPNADRQKLTYDVLTSHSYGQNEPYQAVPIPDPNSSSYDKLSVPYREPTSYQQSEPSHKQPDVISKLYSGSAYSVDNLPSSHSTGFIYSSAQSESTADRVSYPDYPIPNPGPYDSNMAPYTDSSYSQKRINNQPYQSTPVSSNVLRMMVQQSEQNFENIKLQNKGNTYEYQPSVNTKSDAPLSSSSTIAVVRSHENNSAIDNTDSSVDILSKSGWDPYNPYTPSGAYSQLYTSGAEAVKSYPDYYPGASFPYSQGISPYASDYLSESPLRPRVYNPNEAQGQPNAFVSVQSSPIAFVDAKSRVIVPNEYVFPNKMPGGENVIQCRKENELHHFWSQGLDCLVCICFNEYGVLLPVCASCGGCHNPPPKLPELILVQSTSIRPEPLPVPPSELYTPHVPEPYQTTTTPEPYPVYSESVPTPSPFPVPFPEPVATLPPPPDQARCNPLPTGVPFTNPLHPCQICICKEGLGTDNNEVSIDCKDNPQCIAPADVTALPPLPDAPTPIPLPICEKFPENVLFPHPTESCKLCKCAKQLSEDEVYEQQLTCYPHPDCAPKPDPLIEAAPPLPIPVNPYHVSPYPEPTPPPDGVPVEPLPWPPITTISPVPPLPVTPRPGPLPGPSPHESCRPYPPNQTFQHPWDECQLCMCTEATVVGMITVEINCYSKPECCIELPDSVKTALPGKLLHFTGFNAPPLGSSNVANSPDVQVLSSGPQPTTSTYRPPPSYPSYSPTPVNIYPRTNIATDPLNQAPPYSGYVDPASSYPYQTNYPSPYGNPQYSEYPPRLPPLPGTSNTIGQYKPNNFRYPANYRYAQEDAVGNNFSPHGQYQPFDPRFQTVPAPSYPGVYQGAYDRPHLYVPQLRESYVKPPVPALGGPHLQNLAPSYAAPIGYSKSGKDGPDEASR